MKKITLKISAFLLLTMFALQLQAQANFTGDGIYKISTSGLTPNLYLTINTSSGVVEWQPEITPDDETQLWTIQAHRTPASSGLMEITANVAPVGALTLAVADDSAFPNLTFVARPGNPVEVVEGSEDYSGLDQFQRRKTPVGADGLALPSADGGANPPGNPNNNALFVRVPSGNTARYGVEPSAAGEVFQFDGSNPIDVIQYHFVATLSNEEFDTSAIFISNPVNNELSINGLTDNVNKVSVYSLIGQEVISRKLTGQATLTLDVSDLTSGMYLVKLTGANGSFTKKIVKQ